MIPNFPVFKRIEKQDKHEIESLASQFPPYSDFNFVSLYSYDSLGKNELAMLDGNLVMKFHDYITKEPYFTFLGVNNVRQTITQLLDHAKQCEMAQKLILIPEMVVKAEEQLATLFTVQEDPDNADYILSVDELATLSGNKYNAKRNFVNRFKKLYPACQFKVLELNDNRIQSQIVELFKKWEEQKGQTREETGMEYTAIKRVFALLPESSLSAVGIYDKEQLIAFSINDLLKNNYAIIEFEKADTAYTGIFQYLKHMIAMQLQKEGYIYINYEQDLGIPGLRKAKQSWNPISYLKKYTVKPKT